MRGGRVPCVFKLHPGNTVGCAPHSVRHMWLKMQTWGLEVAARSQCWQFTDCHHRGLCPACSSMLAS